MPAEHRLAVRDGGRVREVTLVGTVTVGRSPTCGISSADPRLSRTHAAFEVAGDAVVVRDLGSSNGTTVNGAPITEHQLRAGERVEVGPFVIELVTVAGSVAERRPQVNSNNDATALMPGQARPGAATPRSPVPATTDPEQSSSSTRIIPRSSVAAAMAMPAPSAPAVRDTPAPPLPAPKSPVPPDPAQAVAQAVEAQPAAAPAVPAKPRLAAPDLTFANTALLWIVPVVLISFLAGLIPDFMEQDQRAPLLHAYYVTLANNAVDLTRTSREPAVPIDTVTTGLRRQRGVTGARIIGADGRVLAPLAQAGTTTSPPQLSAADATITDARDGSAAIQVPGRTGDGRPVLIDMTVDPQRVHPAPTRSPLGTVLLLISLGAAWLVARRLTQITDARLAHLGEEVELMTTRQIATGRDPFNLPGGRRILDAVTFALSSAGRIDSAAPRAATRPESSGGVPATASVDADASFRIVSADRGCQGLLGLDPHTASGRHLIDALPDQAVADEVMRLVTAATPAQEANGEVITGDRHERLGIRVTRGSGATPFSIRFTRL